MVMAHSVTRAGTARGPHAPAFGGILARGAPVRGRGAR
jgi:hypothetical protein